MTKFIEEEVVVNNNSIDRVGITKDYKSAIAEYIWNGFDAGASIVEIKFDTNDKTGFLNGIEIIDNGSGISYDELKFSFKPILDSLKYHTNNPSFYTRGKKGRGRFSFICFASNATRDTTYENDKNNKHYNYQIKISGGNKSKYQCSESVIETDKPTGTLVKITNLDGISRFDLEGTDFMYFLKLHFARFLSLNKINNYRIIINGQDMEYKDVIDISREETISLADDGTKNKYDFKLHYILWKDKIGEDSQNYYLDSKQKQRRFEDNQTNNKGDGFYNSLYIISDFFNDFHVVDNKGDKDSCLLITKYHNVFKKLKTEISKFLLAEKRKFLKSNSTKLIRKLYEEDVMPIFGETRYAQIMKEDFENIVKEIYIYEPQIFETSGNKQQKKTILEFLKLLLDDNKREKIVDVMRNIIDLTDQQIEDFSKILQQTSLAYIVNLANFLLNRKNVIVQLNKLIFDLKKFTNERDHIQKIIEENYWLFGEQYHQVSADKNFKKLVEAYQEIIDKKKDNVDNKLDSDNKRVDIFLSRIRNLSSNNPNYSPREHIIVELKRPSVTIGKEQYRQIEDYMEHIKNTPSLSGDLDQWKFYLVGNTYDEFISDKRQEFEDVDDPFLIGRSKGKYRIYCLSWTDLFTVFENSHKHIYDELKINDEKLSLELGLDILDPSRITSDIITSNILDYSKSCKQ